MGSWRHTEFFFRIASLSCTSSRFAQSGSSLDWVSLHSYRRCHRREAESLTSLISVECYAVLFISREAGSFTTFGTNMIAGTATACGASSRFITTNGAAMKTIRENGDAGETRTVALL